jgi:hypothetical protein
LAALGYLLGDVDAASTPDLQRATRSFQQHVMERSEPSGELDAQTCAKLEEMFGS